MSESLIGNIYCPQTTSGVESSGVVYLACAQAGVTVEG